MTATKLPDGFAELEPFVATWAIDNERDRYLKLHRSTIEDLKTFYDAVFARIDEIIDRLNQTPLASFSDEEKRLMNLAMTFAETAHPIDLKWKDVDFNDAYTWEKFQFQGVSTAPLKETA
jgi:enoyl reductase-like protein